jgi:hypothetical protein
MMNQKHWPGVRQLRLEENFQQPLSRFELFGMTPKLPRWQNFQWQVTGAANLEQ